MPKPENIEPFKFQEGQSGNPNGRPKGSRNRSTVAREWLSASQKQKNPISGKDEELTQEDIITLQQIHKARKGDTNAYKAVMDSAYGAPKQDIEFVTDIGTGDIEL
jgi:Family of unknown function (DUF5681)